VKFWNGFRKAIASLNLVLGFRLVSGEKLPALGLLPNFDYEFFSRESAPHPFDRFFGAIRFQVVALSVCDWSFCWIGIDSSASVGHKPWSY
jgi:hypothetical protein